MRTALPILVLIALALATARGQVPPVEWRFSAASPVTLNGDARIVETSDGTVPRLTPAAPWRHGSGFSTDRIPFANTSASFSTFFQFRFSAANGMDAADGIVFVLQPVSSSLGGAGGGIGYLGIPRSVGIEFDTFNNGGYEHDDNHVEIDTNGALTNTGSVNPYGVSSCHPREVRGKPGCMANGALWSVWIDYDGSTLSVAIAENSTQRPAVNLLSLPIDIAAIIGADAAFVGFTSATGAGFENHDIIGWRYVNSYKPIAGPVGRPCRVCILP
jgi:hypothetical protein